MLKSDDRLNLVDLDAEDFVVGAMLRDPAIIPDVVATTSGDALFVFPENLDTYYEIVRMFRAGEPINHVTVGERLSQRGKSDAVKRILHLADSCLSVIGWEIKARKLEQARIRRQLHGLMTTLSAQLNSPDVDALVAIAQQTLANIAFQRRDNPVHHVRDAVAKALDEISERARNGGGMMGVPTHFTDLDCVLGGLRKQTMTILAARPGEGKTALGLEIAASVARSGRPVAFMSIEMSVRELSERLLASASEVDGMALRIGKLQHDSLNRVTLAYNQLGEASLWIVDCCGVTLSGLATLLRGVKLQHDIDLAIVDYCQLIREEKTEKSRYEHVTRVSQGLKSLARSLDIPLLVLAQLNREIESRNDRRPRLSDLRDSGSLEQDADVVMLLFNPRDDADPTKRLLLVEKNRNGPLGDVELTFLRQFTAFRSREKAWQTNPTEF